MSAAEKLAPQPAVPAPKLRVDDRGGPIAVKTLTLDQSKPSTVPGMMSSTLRAGSKGGRVKYQSILFVPRLRSFQIDCLHPDGKTEVVFIPEHLAIQWIPEEVV